MVVSFITGTNTLVEEWLQGIIYEYISNSLILKCYTFEYTI